MLRHRSTVARRLLAVLALSLLVLVPARPAAADSPFGHPMPGGSWSFVRGDSYLHYACKTYIPSSPYGPLYRVRTATWQNGSPHTATHGVWVMISRFNNSTIVSQKYNPHWLYGFSGNETYASAILGDRIWMQADGYGPSPYYTGGVPVKNLRNC